MISAITRVSSTSSTIHWNPATLALSRRTFMVTLRAAFPKGHQRTVMQCQYLLNPSCSKSTKTFMKMQITCNLLRSISERGLELMILACQAVSLGQEMTTTKSSLAPSGTTCSVEAKATMSCMALKETTPCQEEETWVPAKTGSSAMQATIQYS